MRDARAVEQVRSAFLLREAADQRDAQALVGRDPRRPQGGGWPVKSIVRHDDDIADLGISADTPRDIDRRAYDPIGAFDQRRAGLAPRHDIGAKLEAPLSEADSASGFIGLSAILKFAGEKKHSRISI